METARIGNVLENAAKRVSDSLIISRQILKANPETSSGAYKVVHRLRGLDSFWTFFRPVAVLGLCTSSLLSV